MRAAPASSSRSGPRRRARAAFSYDQDLALLREELLAMGGKVEAGIAASIRAVLERDSALARGVIDGDGDVDRLELGVDDTCRRLLVSRHPAADLRFITTALKIVVDLERMGDLAVNIAERAMELAWHPPLRPVPRLSSLADLCRKQVRAALSAFVGLDVSRAQKAIVSDELVDARYRALFNELIGLMMEDPKHIRSGNSMLFVAKHLERIADHAVNVAEMTIFMVRGKDVRHPRSRAAV